MSIPVNIAFACGHQPKGLRIGFQLPFACQYVSDGRKVRFPKALGPPGLSNTVVVGLSGGGGGLARGHGVGLFAFGGANSRPTMGPNVFWLCQRSPWMTCPV